ncbi:MAG: aminodeoxychorismate/anthranilate synthase component II [Planctomycetota bacterium]|nr:aminodeoxychorismate/anthranilate synthase component II [Planctomycetota bacterium]
MEQAELCHGQTRPVLHDGRGVFDGVLSPVELTRYNSLHVSRAGLPAELEVAATGCDGHVEGLRHRSRPLEGVQSHPESVLCLEGRRLLENFAALCRGRRRGDRVGPPSPPAEA